jgi:hypothetical protein
VAAPRIFCITAPDAGVAAVIRRGPSEWCHLGCWDFTNHAYEPGSWLHGTIYPQRCDVSPDGTLFSCLILKAGATWAAGQTYVAVSRLPWLAALAAWRTDGTWSRGAHFVDDRDVWDVGEPDVGDSAPIRRDFGLAVARATSFAVERRRGWVESPGTPPRAADDVWDVRREVTMQKASPRDPEAVLTVRGGYAAHRELQPTKAGLPGYTFGHGTRAQELGDVWWADWSNDGDLLVSTTDGKLQTRKDDGRTVKWEQDLAGMTPDPAAPPPQPG